MLFNLSKLSIFISIFQLLQFSIASDEAVRFITSDGVVYSYAVVTSTIKPATVIVRTSTYTTTRVREITLSNNEVTTTTENIITQATVLSSVAAESQDPSTTSTFATSSTSAAVLTLQPDDVSSEAQDTLVSSTSSTSSTASVNPIQTSDIETLVSTTSSSTPATTSNSSIHSTTSSSSVPSTTSTSSVALTTDVDSGTCYVYYDDPNDEYYSTVYLTDSTQSVDAATTLTSTTIVYSTMTR